MTSSVIAAMARSTRIAPCCAAHRSVTATTVDAAKMNTHVATRITRYRAAGRRSPGALDSAPRSPSSSWIGRPRVASSAGARRAARRSRSPSGPGETTISARNAISAIPSSASNVSSGTCFPRVRTAPGRVRASYPGRPILPLRHMPHPVRAVTAWPPINGVLGPSAAPGGTAGRAVTASGSRRQRLRTVSASPTGSSASSGAGTRTSRSRARPGSCAAARTGTGAAPRCPRRPPPRGCRRCPR